MAPLADLPCRIEYSVLVDRQWRARHVTSTIVTPAGTRKIEIQSRSNDGWDLDGVSAPYLDGCDDVDLGWSPATNTIPIRRLELDVGESARICAAWIRFPELDVVRNEQSYTRVSSNRWK